MKLKNILIAFTLLSTTAAFSEPTLEQNSTMELKEDASETQNQPLNTHKINQLLIQKEKLNKELADNNIWSKIYSNYHTYKELEKQHIAIRGPSGWTLKHGPSSLPNKQLALV